MAFHSNLDMTDQSIELVGARTVELVLRNHAAVETQHNYSESLHTQNGHKWENIISGS